jgi:phenylacetate-coenzyme A ligase PaaK-like adenylate-forming protein
VQDTVASIGGLTGSVQMEKQREGGRDRLVIRVETEAPADRLADLTRQFERAIVERRPSLRHFIEEGTVWPLKVELVRPGSLQRNARTGKLIRVIDAI